jgi:hypothetical protein
MIYKEFIIKKIIIFLNENNFNKSEIKIINALLNKLNPKVKIE